MSSDWKDRELQSNSTLQEIGYAQGTKWYKGVQYSYHL